MPNLILLWLFGVLGVIVLTWVLTRAPKFGDESQGRALFRMFCRAFSWSLLLAPIAIATGMSGVILPASLGLTTCLVEMAQGTVAPHSESHGLLGLAVISILITSCVLFLIFGAIQQSVYPKNKQTKADVAS